MSSLGEPTEAYYEDRRHTEVVTRNFAIVSILLGCFIIGGVLMGFGSLINLLGQFILVMWGIFVWSFQHFFKIVFLVIGFLLLICGVSVISK